MFKILINFSNIKHPLNSYKCNQLNFTKLSSHLETNLVPHCSSKFGNSELHDFLINFCDLLILKWVICVSKFSDCASLDADLIENSNLCL